VIGSSWGTARSFRAGASTEAKSAGTTASIVAAEPELVDLAGSWSEVQAPGDDEQEEEVIFSAFLDKERQQNITEITNIFASSALLCSA